MPVSPVPPTNFALTKIRPPSTRGHLVPRPALERRLNEGFASRKLTLLSAPAGFGKTAALTRQIDLLPAGTALAWIGADEDDDLHRFLACLITALEAFDLPWRTEPDALIAAAVNAQDERGTVANELLNALAACEAPRGIVVLDDAHRLRDADVFDFIDRLLERLPERWGFVIGTRTDPPLALARLRAQNELLEVRQAELRFDRVEIAALLRASGAGHGATDAEVTHLLARTRGWAAALRLTLSVPQQGSDSAQNRTARVLDRHVFDYLAAEVLDDMSPEMRSFLMRCSVLPQLTASRCALISGNSHAAQLLEELERRDLFVSVTEASEIVLTLHELFRDCLQDRLRREHPDEVPSLLRAAAESEPDLIRRLSLLLNAGAWQEAEAALDVVAGELLGGGVVEAVPRLIDQFPAERRNASPLIALVRGLVAWHRWDWPEMVVAMRTAVAGFARTGDERRRQRALVLEAIALTGSGWTQESAVKLAELPFEAEELETRALAHALRAWHALDTGDFGAVAHGYSKVLDALEQLEAFQVWYVTFLRPLYVRLPGMRAPLTRFVQGVMQRIGDSPARIRALAHAISAWLALWRGEVNEALDLIAAGEAESRWFGLPANLRTSLDTVRAATHAVRGDREAAMAAVRSLLSDFEQQARRASVQGRTSMLGHYVFYGLRVADAVGDAAAVRELAARMPKPEAITNAGMLRAPMLTIPARLAANDGRHMEACAHWERALTNAQAIDIIGQAQEARTRYAASLLELGRRSDAAAALRSVFDEAAATGEIGGALLAGHAVISRLAGAAWRGELQADQAAQLREWMRLAESPAKPQSSQRGRERLSAREGEILARIAEGDSNKAIARAFDLSPHTVKRHVANILDKLGVSSRSQAAQWYRAQA